MTTTTIKSIVFLLSMVFFQISCQNSEKATTGEVVADTKPATAMLPHDSPAPPQALAINNQIPNELVCMVNDAYMGIKQFPVPVGDKIYYGCCENCVDKLQKSDEFRYAKDPFSGEKVDKVEAYIVRQSEKNYAVFYFKSKENYDKYMSKISS